MPYGKHGGTIFKSTHTIIIIITIRINASEINLFLAVATVFGAYPSSDARKCKITRNQ